MIINDGDGGNVLYLNYVSLGKIRTNLRMIIDCINMHAY